MKHSSSESSHRDESNGGSSESLGLIHKELDANMLKIFTYLIFYMDILTSISLCIRPRDAKLLPLDSSL
jgi:hypothetical protein